VKSFFAFSLYFIVQTNNVVVEAEHEQLSMVHYARPEENRLVKHNIIMDPRYYGYVADGGAPVEPRVGHSLFQLIVIVGEEFVARLGAYIPHGLPEKRLLQNLQQFFWKAVVAEARKLVFFSIHGLGVGACAYVMARGDLVTRRPFDT
jgi:membrane-bound acyltransferase YfiQ involved in biofilm formation